MAEFWSLEVVPGGDNVDLQCTWKQALVALGLSQALTHIHYPHLFLMFLFQREKGKNFVLGGHT